MRRSYDPEQTRERLLTAAGDILLEHGSDRLTLDAVAQRAGVSKGGLLYHFRSKEALIRALVEYELAIFDAQIEQALDPSEPPGTPGRWTRAYLHASLMTNPRTSELTAALDAIVIADRELTGLVAASFSRIQQAIEADGLDPVHATIVRLAIDGLCMQEWFNAAWLPAPRREQLVAALLAMTRPSPGAG